METATGPPALDMLKQCGLLPPPAGSIILDNACGAGVVTARLFEATHANGKDLTIICGDYSQNMVDQTNERINMKGWHAKAERIDAQANFYGDSHFTHVLMNFGPQLMSDPMLALKETHRVLRKGGCFGFTCWAKPGWLPPLKEAIPSITLPPTLEGAWKDPDAIRTNLSSTGFTDIKVTALDFETREEDVDQYLGLMKILLAKALVGENAVAYERQTRAKYAQGDKTLFWQALVVSAVKQ